MRRSAAPLCAELETDADLLKVTILSDMGGFPIAFARWGSFAVEFDRFVRFFGLSRY
jgi:hypothetical protein